MSESQREKRQSPCRNSYLQIVSSRHGSWVPRSSMSWSHHGLHRKMRRRREHGPSGILTLWRNPSFSQKVALKIRQGASAYEEELHRNLKIDLREDMQQYPWHCFKKTCSQPKIWVQDHSLTDNPTGSINPIPNLGPTCKQRFDPQTSSIPVCLPWLLFQSSQLLAFHCSAISCSSRWNKESFPKCGAQSLWNTTQETPALPGPPVPTLFLAG